MPLGLGARGLVEVGWAKEREVRKRAARAAEAMGTRVRVFMGGV
jgi:hypothetical protein